MADPFFVDFDGGAGPLPRYGRAYVVLGRAASAVISLADPINQYPASVDADAFAKAKSQATRTAEAAGAQLGSLLRVADNASAAMGMDESSYFGGGYDPYTMARMQRQGMMAFSPAEDEAVSMQPGHVPARIVITAVFELK